MILKVNKIKKEYGIQDLLDIEKLEIWDGERIGLVGINGSGKSTLLHILYGDLEADSGNIERKCQIAMIPQWGDSDGEASEFYRSQLGIRNKNINSGGEKTRLAIARACSMQAPLLLADEPTTNLDEAGLETLETLLLEYAGALVIISHDRILLDRICNTIWSLEDGKIRVFPGSYSQWEEQCKREREFAKFEYQQYQKEKKRLTSAAREVKQQAKGVKLPSRLGNSESRLYRGSVKESQRKIENQAKMLKGRLENLEEKKRPVEWPEIKMSLGSSSLVKAKTAVKFNHVTIAYDNKVVINDFNLELPTGKRSFLKGGNGSGKTTLIRHLMIGGSGVSITQGVKIGYVSQEHETLDWNKSVLENVRYLSTGSESVDRSVLANLNLTELDIHKKISVLSGGERVKTALAQVLVSECNLLILDEPTNHMDIITIEALERLLKQWQGTMLIISHDRAFTDHLAEELFYLP